MITPKVKQILLYLGGGYEGVSNRESSDLKIGQSAHHIAGSRVS